VAALLLAELIVRGLGWMPSDDYFNPAGERMGWVRFDWVLGPRARPGYRGPWSSGFPSAGFPVAIDAHGFRATPERDSEGGARVALLGDSCTFGWGLATDETFAAGLAERVGPEGRSVEILNAGFPGDSAVAGPHLLREWVLGQDPDLLVLGYSGNNAFRLSALSDVERYQRAPLRKLVLSSRLAGLILASLSRPTEPGLNPRRWEAFGDRPAARWHRIASPDVFEASLREMVTLASHAGVEVAFLLFPRASQVSSRFAYEDPALRFRAEGLPDPSREASTTSLEASLLQYSCLDVGAPDSLELLRARAGDWRVFYFGRNVRLDQGARAYVAGRFAVAEKAFRDVLREDPGSPLALYDLGSTLLAQGRIEAGFGFLAEAERLSCSIFLRYQTILWRVATEYGIPVIDLMLHFQAHDANRLFMDPAHPSAEARDVIASALWPVVQRLGARGS
jgi:lysophospholipase L1-like esterase